MRASFLSLLLLTSPALAAVRTETVAYVHDGKPMEGFLAWDDAAIGPRPGVLVIQEWWGINDHIRNQTRRLAELGYVAFAPDIYGKGIRPTTPQEAGKLATAYKKDILLLRARVKAGLDVLLKQRSVDPKRLAAIGFCFGGTTALELARSGAPLVGTVSIHGGLATPDPSDAKNIKGRVLALTGGADPSVPPEQVGAFEKEMNEAHVDWSLIAYGGAVHAFTNPGAGDDPSKGVAYNERAAKRSWEDLKAFLAAVFSP